jgi:hypothetical protein
VTPAMFDEVRFSANWVMRALLPVR